jgi:radical SAM superfamily enzyme YgiQ (UPF0313 family)
MKNKVVLLFPETHRNRSEDAWCLAPLSLLALSGPLSERGLEVRIIDARVDPDPLEQLACEAKDAICVGITALTGQQIKGALAASLEMKRLFPGLPVVWGGYHATLLPLETIRHPAVDVVVRGQGESSFLAVVEALRAGASLRGIPGVVWKEDQRILFNPEPGFQDVNRFPPAPFHLIDHGRHRPDLGYAHRVLAYASSQGCPHDCGFCAESTAYRVRWSGLAPERVASDLAGLMAAAPADGFIFVDNNFFVSETRVQGICRAFIDRGWRFPWAAQGRADRIAGLSAGTFALLRESGFKVFHVGAESGSDEVLEGVTKNLERETTLACARAVKAAGLHISFGFIFGFPGETGRDIQANFSLMEAVTRIQGSYDCIVHFYAPAPGTPLLEAARALGAEPPAALEEWIPWNTVRGVTPWVDAAYIDQIRRRTDFYYPFARPNWMLRRRATRRWHQRLLFALVHLASRFRVRLGFFGFPVEWWASKRLVGRFR